MLELKDLLTLLSILVAAVSIVLVSRNARRATAISARVAEAHAQNVDLTRIRDLRHELSETKHELDKVKTEATHLAEQLTEANRLQIEMVLYARMPGVTIEDWRARFDGPSAIGAPR